MIRLQCLICFSHKQKQMCYCCKNVYTVFMTHKLLSMILVHLNSLHKGYSYDKISGQMLQNLWKSSFLVHVCDRFKFSTLQCVAHYKRVTEVICISSNFTSVNCVTDVERVKRHVFYVFNALFYLCNIMFIYSLSQCYHFLSFF